MIRLLGYIVVFLTSFSLTYSESVTDTVGKKFPEVTVEGKKELTNQGFNYISSQLLDSKSIEKIRPIQIIDALQYIAGVNIRDYGGLGSIKTISLRGLPSNQTLVLIDGLRLNNSQTGIADVSKIFVSSIGRIEVAKSSSSSLYGSNAMAGIVNLISKTELQDKYKFTASYDSFTNKIFEAEVTQNIDSIPLALKMRKTNSDGTYSFKVGDERYERQNSQVDNLDLYLGTVFGWGDFTLKPKLIIRESQTGSPEPVLAGVQRASNAFLKESDLTAIVSANNYINDSTEFKIGAVYSYSDLQYKNENAIEFGANGLDNDFYNNGMQIRSEYNSKYKNLYYGFVADANINTLSGDMLQKTQNNIGRQDIGISGNMNYTKKSVVIEYSFFSSFRADYSSDFSSNYSPMLGASANVVEANLISKASLSTGYRLPSFNEMYYLNYGNQNLQPEKSITYNLGLDYEPPKFGRFGLNLFYTNTKDQIAAVPTGPITWQSQNIDKVNTKGIEFFANITPIKGLNLIYNYIYQEPLIKSVEAEEKILVPYTPQEIISALVSYDISSFQFGTSMQYKSYVFTTIDNDLGLIIDDFTLFDVFFSYKPELYGGKLLLRLDMKNIFDEQYQLFLNYPMPGRNIRGTISYEI
ncbi:TonB-dependent receptor [bacterium]|nr:MAG: TonB-dependent receptor [bacterium]